MNNNFRTISLPNNTTATTAMRKLKEQQAKGHNVKLVRHSGIYTQPGRGILAFVNYSIQAK
jgi:Ran GTPase-activating protein (RanGAP) involved in mRNA processing and transport